RKNLAQALKCPTEAVNVKAKTTEGMAFEGRGEGISAHAVALITSD
ncbi:MAG: 2-C-methyl-D-erythritol 2,4-cyclodiphosphate synthase, partial [Clostridia bacterium]|nr:2-C-methyl-D-erythritol 2,4-cyclodiphosphate synthase [Clostridia bacterium]